MEGSLIRFGGDDFACGIFPVYYKNLGLEEPSVIDRWSRVTLSFTESMSVSLGVPGCRGLTACLNFTELRTTVGTLGSSVFVYGEKEHFHLQREQATQISSQAIQGNLRT